MPKNGKKRKTDFQILKTSTGEIVGEYFPRKKPHKFYIIFYREMAKENLIFGLIGEMDQKNRIVIDARLKSVLAHDYGTSPRFIQKTFNRMVSKGWALRLSRGHYFVSPFLFCKADLDTLEILKAEYSKIQAEQNKKKETESELQKDEESQHKCIGA